MHTHITNTRIGDVELLERRYPVLVHQFGIRDGSGGHGKWDGGDGAVREIEFTEGLQVSILSERRTRQPYGMEGGEPGAMGRNTWIKMPRKEDGDLVERDEDVLPDAEKSKQVRDPLEPRRVNIGGKATVWMGKGDRLLIETPGAGAWGRRDDGECDEEAERLQESHAHVGKIPWAARGSLAEREAAQAGF